MVTEFKKMEIMLKSMIWWLKVQAWVRYEQHSICLYKNGRHLGFSPSFTHYNKKWILQVNSVSKLHYDPWRDDYLCEFKSDMGITQIYAEIDILGVGVISIQSLTYSYYNTSIILIMWRIPISIHHKDTFDQICSVQTRN